MMTGEGMAGGTAREGLHLELSIGKKGLGRLGKRKSR
jgi:hypothetical protein